MTKHPVQWALIVVLTMIGFLSIGESIWWRTSTQSYPRILIGAAPAQANDLASLRQACGEPLEVSQDKGDKALVRCGSFWPMRSIWSVPKSEVAPTL